MTDPNPALGLIIKTNATCKLKGRAWPGIPTLIWPEGIDEDASDWFRALIVEQGVQASTSLEYAKVVRPFLRFCRERNRPWKSVDDAFLVIWRERLRRQENVTNNRVNTSMKTIFAFYRWAEETRRVRYQVGVYTEDELPASLADSAFPISAKRVFTKGRSGRVHGGWTTPLTLGASRQETHVRHTPTEDEIKALHEIAIDRVHGERDSLMFSWAEEAGPRRAEFMRVGRSHMPSDDQLGTIIERDEPWVVVIKRKGGRSKPLNVPPDLIIRTLDYIQFGRREIVERCLKTKVAYREPDEIFLSGTTGMALHVDSVTAIGRRAFASAGIRHASIHRLRARYAVRTIETLVDAIFENEMIGSESSWVETILVKAAEQMGHSHPQSLKPYLTYVLNRRVQTADAMKAERLASRLRQLALHEGTIVRRLQHSRGLHDAARLMQAGENTEAASTLRRIADELTKAGNL